MRDTTAPRLPLLNLDDDVCFPGTELEVRVTEPAGRRLVRDLLEVEEPRRWLGVVLPRPDGGHDPLGRPEVFPGGTAARLLEVEGRESGATDVLLAGGYRFAITRELPGHQPYRRAEVRPLTEDDTGEGGDTADLRRELLDLAESLLPELGDKLALDGADLARLRHRVPFAQLVNRLAAGLDVPPLRKLELLLAPLAERGRGLLSILESRRFVLDQLRPWRHLADDPELN